MRNQAKGTEISTTASASHVSARLRGGTGTQRMPRKNPEKNTSAQPKGLKNQGISGAQGREGRSMRPNCVASHSPAISAAAAGVPPARRAAMTKGTSARITRYIGRMSK